MLDLLSLGTEVTDHKLTISPALAVRVLLYVVNNPTYQYYNKDFRQHVTVTTHFGHCMQLMQPDTDLVAFLSFPVPMRLQRKIVACLACLTSSDWKYFRPEQYVYWFGIFNEAQQETILALLMAEVRRKDTGVTHV